MKTLELSLTEVHNKCSDMLKDIINLCEKNQITYFAIYGTLLGAIRHNGPIPWDPDVDLYVPDHEIPLLIDAVNTQLNNKYWVDYRQKGDYPKAFPRIGYKGYETSILHIDIFRMSGLPDNYNERMRITRKGNRLRIIRRLKDKSVNNEVDKTLKAKLLKTLVYFIPTNWIIKEIDNLCGKYRTFSTNYVGRVLGNGAIYEASKFSSYILMPYDNFEIRVPVGYDSLLKQMYGDYMQYPPEAERRKFEEAIYVIKPLKK